MSEFTPGYSDEPQYWTNAFKNQYTRRYNVGFLRHKLAQVCRSKVSVHEYYDDIVVRLSDPKDISPVTEVLTYYTGKKPYWRDVGGYESDGKQWVKKYDIITELYDLTKIKEAEEDGYRLRPLLPDDGQGMYPAGVGVR